MAPTIKAQLDNVHPQMLRVGSESDRKQFADHRGVVGQLVETALDILGLTQQEAAYRMGYRDSGTVSRWCTGTERPQFDKLLLLDGFAEAWVIAIARHTKAGIDVHTVITVRRSA